MVTKTIRNHRQDSEQGVVAAHWHLDDRTLTTVEHHTTTFAIALYSSALITFSRSYDCCVPGSALEKLTGQRHKNECGSRILVYTVTSTPETCFITFCQLFVSSISFLCALYESRHRKSAFSGRQRRSAINVFEPSQHRTQQGRDLYKY